MDIARAEVHQKVWGYECWVVNNDKYCGKRLLIKAGWQCSLHYHKVKDETFYVLSGAVRMELDGEVRTLYPGDTVHIPPGKVHRFAGIHTSVIIEFSTHHDEEDSYRLEGELSGPIRPAAWLIGGPQTEAVKRFTENGA